MTNAFYNPTGNPGTGSEGLSAVIRAEFANIASGFALLPVVSGNGGAAVVVNPGGTALTVTGGLSLAGNLTTTGAFSTTFAQGASVTLTLPTSSGTLATLAGTETLSNKTLVAPALGTPVSGTMTNVTGTASGLTAGNATTAVNLSGGTVAATTISASGTVSGAGFSALFESPPPIGSTVANTGAFSTLVATMLDSTPIGSVSPSTGAFTTLSASSTVSGSGFDTYLAAGTKPASFTTLAASSTVSGAGFTARFASPGPIGSSSASTGAFTTLSATSTVSGAGITALFASPPSIGGTAPGTGAFTTISATGVITSTVSTGTAPFQVSSTTNVANLNASSLGGATFASPGAIGGTTASTGAFTTISATGLISPASGTGVKGSATALPAGSIGETIQASPANSSFAEATPTNIATLTIPTAGVWNVFATALLSDFSGVTTMIQGILNVTINSASIAPGARAGFVIGAGGIAEMDLATGPFYLVTTGSTLVYAVAYVATLAGTGGKMTNALLTAIRIA